MGALILMMSHSLWWHSTMLEVYALNTAILAGMLLCIVRYNQSGKLKNLYSASFLLGLGCSNHLLMAFFIFGFIAVIVCLMLKRQTLTFYALSILLGCFLLGAGLYLVVFTRDYLHYLRLISVRQPVQSQLGKVFNALSATVDNATGKGFRSYMFPGNVSIAEKRFWRMNYIILLNYPFAAILFALFGFFSFWKRKLLRISFLFFMIGLAAQIAWSSNFFIWDMYAFSLPVYVLLSLPMVFALHHQYTIFKSGRALMLLILPLLMISPLVYTLVSDYGEKDGIMRRYFQKYPE